MTWPGMVAENSMVCRLLGSISMIFSTSGRKPRSSISSASSSTSARTEERSSLRCPARSSSRPGVPTTTSTPLLERLDLRFVGPAAVDREDPDVADLAGCQQVVGDLGAQLAGGDDDERLGSVGQRLGLGPSGLDVGGHGDPLQQRQAEAQRLAGAGLGLADDVVAGQCDRERHLLDGERGGDADGVERLDGLGEDPEITESRGGQDACLFHERGTVRVRGVEHP